MGFFRRVVAQRALSGVEGRVRVYPDRLFQCLAAAILIAVSACAPRRLPPGPPTPTEAPAPPIATGTEELWIIAKSSAAGTAAGAPMLPYLQRRSPGAHGGEALPPQHTAVHAAVAGYVATVSVQQQFLNPFEEGIEVEYVFALPADAAVSDFVMTIGERTIRGFVRERQEAEQIYTEAKQQGYVASLLTEERANIFKQAVANVAPGKEIDIDVTYFNTLGYRDGEYEFVFPLGVHGNRNGHGQGQGHGNANGVELAADIDAGLRIESIHSPSHEVTIQHLSAERAHVELTRHDPLPDKDFVLRFKTAGDEVKSGFVAHRDERGGFFTLMLQPPAELSRVPRQPLEMIFVLDCSSRIAGVPIARARAVIERALQRLDTNDSFEIIGCSESDSPFAPRPVPAVAENVERAIGWVEGQGSSGNTSIIHGIQTALDFPRDPMKMRILALLSDGYIGEEEAVLAVVRRHLGEARVFSFAVGSPINLHVLGEMARLGRGALVFVDLNDGTQSHIDDFLERIRHPALTDVQVDWDTLDVSDVHPAPIPDLFVGRPILLSGRFRGTAPAAIRISGRVGGKRHNYTLNVGAGELSEEHAALASLWARAQIADLEFQGLTHEPGWAATRIEPVALEYGIVSPYSAFLAIDAAR